MADGTEKIMDRMIQSNNKAEFKKKFSGNYRDTLPYIFAMDKFLKVQDIRDDTIKFRKIFNSIDEGYQDLYIGEQPEDAKLTIESLQKWLLTTFPPPPMKHEWVIKLKRIRMRKNEDPLLVYGRYKALLKKINKAIDYINVGIPAIPDQVKKITGDQKCEILTGIFIRNNDKAELDNDGKINHKVKKLIASKDPRKIMDWVQIFREIKIYISLLL